MSFVDLNSLLTGQTPGGTWTQGDCNGINNNPQVLSPFNPANLDFSAAIPGDYTFAYFVTDGTCSDCEEVMVEVLETPDLILPPGFEVCCINGSASGTIMGQVLNMSDGQPYTDPYVVIWSINGGLPISVPNDPNLDFDVPCGGQLNIIATVENTGTNPVCQDEPQFLTITVADNIYAGDPTTTTICPTNPFDLTTLLINSVIPGGATTAWMQISGPAVSLIDPTMVDMSQVGTYVFNFSVSIPGGPGVCEHNVDITVEVTDLSSGTATPLEACGPPVTLDLTSAVTGVTVPPGATTDWIQTSGSPVDVTDPTMVDFTQAGVYTFDFVVQDGDCTSTTEVTVTIYDQANAGTAIPLNLCNEDNLIDLFTGLSGADPGGTFELTLAPVGQTLGTIGQPIANPVNFDGQPPGTYQFTYTVGPAACEDDEVITVTLYETPIVDIPDGPLDFCVVGLGSTTMELITATTVNSSDGAPFTGNVTYAWTLNGSPVGGTGDNVTVTIGQGNHTLCVTATETDSGFSCDSMDCTTLTVTTIEAGTGLTTDLCIPPPPNDEINVNLNGFVTGAITPVSATVNWVQISGPVVVVPPSGDPVTINTTGTYVFEKTTDFTSAQDNCVDTTQVTLNVFQTPTVVPANDGEICLDGSIDLSTLTVGSDPGGTYTLNNGPGTPNIVGSNADFLGEPPGVYLFEYEVSDGPCSASTSFTVTVRDIPVPDLGPDQVICNFTGTVNYTVGASITSQYDGGPFPGSEPVTYSWTENGSPIGGNSPTLNITNQPPGQYTYVVTACNSLACCNQDTLIVDVSPYVDSGVGAPLALSCAQDLTCIDLTAQITGDNVPGGGSSTWIDVDITGVDLTDPTCVDFSAVPAGTYQFDYQVSYTTPPFNCVETTSINVSISDDPSSAGDPQNVTLVCPIGPSWTLNFFNDLIVPASDPDGNGDWTIVGSTSGFPVDLAVDTIPGSYNNADPVGTDDNPQVDFSNTAPGTYTFRYTVQNGTCTIDTMDAQVTVPCCANAGTGGSIFACNNQIIDLFTGLSGADPGGQFRLTAAPVGQTIGTVGNIISNPVDFDQQPAGTYTFDYEQTVGGCTDIATITVNIGEVVVVTITSPPPPTHVCHGTPLVINYTLTNYSDGSPYSGPNVTVSFFQEATLITFISTNMDGSFNINASNLTLNEITRIYRVTAETQGMSVCFSEDQVLMQVAPKVDAGAPASIGLICNPEVCYDFTVHRAGQCVPNNATETYTGIGGASGLDFSDPTCVDLTSLAGGSYSLTYEVSWNNWAGSPPGAPVCSDSTTFDFDVSDGGSAGTPQPPPDICNDQTAVDLSSLLSGEDPGGTYTFTQGPDDIQDNLGNPILVGGTFTNPVVGFDQVLPGNYQFSYTVGSPPCDDTAFFSVNVGVVPVVNLPADQFLCNYEGDVDYNLVSTVDPYGLMPPYPGSLTYAWTENGSPVGTGMPSLVVTNQPEGTYIYNLTVTGTVNGVDCIGVGTTTVNVSPWLNAGTPVSPISVDCDVQAIHNVASWFTGQVVPAGATDQYIDLDGAGLDFTDPTMVDFSGVADGSYTIVHIVSYTVGGFNCSDQASIVVNVTNCEQVCDYVWRWFDSPTYGADIKEITEVHYTGGLIPLPNYPYVLSGLCTPCAGAATYVDLVTDLQAWVDANGVGTVNIVSFGGPLCDPGQRLDVFEITGSSIEFTCFSIVSLPGCVAVNCPEPETSFTQSNCV